MIRVELNIGLKRNDRGDVELRAVERIAYNPSVSIFSAREENSRTEPTAVCRFVWLGTPSAFRSWVNALCLTFAQDCIAAYYAQDGAGELIGPKAAEWGAFDLRQFIRYPDKSLDTAQQR